jgi:hypothetical protein
MKCEKQYGKGKGKTTPQVSPRTKSVIFPGSRFLLILTNDRPANFTKNFLKI